MHGQAHKGDTHVANNNDHDNTIFANDNSNDISTKGYRIQATIDGLETFLLLDMGATVSLLREGSREMPRRKSCFPGLPK